jgi:hypothetical protein
MSTSLYRISLAAFMSSLCACGQAQATLSLMDAPPSGVTAVSIFVASMDVHVNDGGTGGDSGSNPNDATIDDDDKWHSLSVNKSIDLVQHQGESAAAMLGQLELPAGKITQLRLVIDTTKANTATYNGSSCALDTTKVETRGIKINHVFKALSASKGDKVDITVDFDLADSLSPKGDCFELSPRLKLHKVKLNDTEQSI